MRIRCRDEHRRGGAVPDEAIRRGSCPPDVEVGRLQEVFHHPAFLDATDDERRMIMLSSSESSYQHELEHPWDKYFNMDLRPLLAGADALDLGCFNGGEASRGARGIGSGT